jgi:hypothetical protein
MYLYRAPSSPAFPDATRVDAYAKKIKVYLVRETSGMKQKRWISSPKQNQGVKRYCAKTTNSGQLQMHFPISEEVVLLLRYPRTTTIYQASCRNCCGRRDFAWEQSSCRDF